MVRWGNLEWGNLQRTTSVFCTKKAMLDKLTVVLYEGSLVHLLTMGSRVPGSSFTGQLYGILAKIHSFEGCYHSLCA